MPNPDLSKIEYIPWLEQALQELVAFPVKSICMFAVANDGAVYINYHNVRVGDKIKIAGLIQQNAMIDRLRNEGLIDAE